MYKLLNRDLSVGCRKRKVDNCKEPKSFVADQRCMLCGITLFLFCNSLLVGNILKGTN